MTEHMIVQHISSSEALELFSEYQLAQNLSTNTVRNRRSLLTGLERTGADLLTADVFTLRRYMGRPNLAPSTKRTIRDALASFYRFLVDEGLRDDNPTERLPRVHVPKGTPRPFTREQIWAMLTSGAYRRTRAMILIGFYQGFRVSQIARVHGSHIDVAAGTITTVGKGGKEGFLPLHPVIAELAKTMPKDDYWFPARRGRGGHISGHAVTDLITDAKHRAGITDPRLTPHSLRHGYGTELVEAEVDIRVVQVLMMHESLTTTEIYTEVSERRKRAGINAIPSMPIPEHSGRTLARAA